MYQYYNATSAMLSRTIKLGSAPQLNKDAPYVPEGITTVRVLTMASPTAGTAVHMGTWQLSGDAAQN